MAGSSQAISIAVPTRLKLAVTQGPCEGQSFDSSSFSSSYLTVGRTKKSKIFLKDASISEKHAEIVWDARSSSWTLRDTDSSNGTRVNGAKLQPYCAHMLKAGEHIAFGQDTIVTVELEDQTLNDVNVETLLRAHVESICQALESAAAGAAHEMVRSCHEALDALLVQPGA